jgi:hypothetical protein
LGLFHAEEIGLLAASCLLFFPHNVLNICS